MPKCNIVEEDEPRVIKMAEMAPLQVGRVIDEGYAYNHLVWRTASTAKFEVVDLSTYGQDSCWTDPKGVEVRLLPAKKGITIVLMND